MAEWLILSPQLGQYFFGFSFMEQADYIFDLAKVD
jgi:hypothetical protein